ncbi:MAG: O-linked N-acetylglucosamine transferase, SPINDLY family protein [Leptolyngbyaceae cyanobacterium HOT.MB2.61]|nr:O-linked N-acetylglucosamine transferase, SPINDLY family protein [Leptolyngbyaceae cyanobacterium HOT.MB2.61]
MIEVSPVEVVGWRQQAEQCLLAGNYAQAADLYQRLIEAEPETKMHCWHLGLALLLQEQEAEAQTVWMLAMVEGNSSQVQQWTAELVSVLEAEAEQREESHDYPTAWAIRQHIREIAPENLTNLLHLMQLSIESGTFSAENLANLGVIPLLHGATRDTVDSDLLLQSLKRLLAIAPLEPITLDFAAACLKHRSQVLEFVLVLMHRAIEIGNNMGQPLVAVDYAKRCLEALPNNLSILGHLSHFYQNANHHTEGIEAARQYCTIARALPDQVFGAFLMLRSLLRAGGYWDSIFPIFEHQDVLIEELVNTQVEPLDQATVFQLTTSTFCQPYIRDSLVKNRLNQNRLMQVCQSSVQTYSRELVDRFQQGFATRSTRRDGTHPLRIGYVSHCMRRHSVGWLSRWLFNYHNRERFHLYGYFWNSQELVTDSLQRWFMERVHHPRILGRDSQEIANRIFEDEIDILVDLDSITADIICEVMMLKPAPVQVTWLGWDASGIPAIDYYIADPYVLPDYAENHYAEKIWRLPQTYIAVDGFEVGVPTLRREDLDIPGDAVIYWSGQSAYKRHPNTVRSQLQIIKAVPNSYFLIKGINDEGSIQQYFLQMAAEIGVDSSRLRFLPDVAEEQTHRANLGIADVVLDTYPYNGATTTLETLWMGIPMVTRVGEHFSSRNSYTMMVNAGISEGIAWTDEEYVEWGVGLGKDPQLRQQIAWKLWKSRATAPLWNAKAFTQQMENAYEKMWEMGR